MGKACEGYSDFRVSVNETSVEVGKTEEQLNVFNFSRFGPILDNLERGDVKLALIGSDKESISSESLDYLLNMGLVFGHIARVDKNVDDDCDINHICENVIHKSLEGCGCIGKPFRHYRPLERAVSSSECSFPFVSGCDSDQVVRMLEINLGVNSCLLGCVS